MNMAILVNALQTIAYILSCRILSYHDVLYRAVISHFIDFHIVSYPNVSYHIESSCIVLS